MIPAIYYHLFYLLFISFLSILAFAKYPWGTSLQPIIKTDNVKFRFDILLFIFLVFFIGFRDPYSRVFVDTAAYTLFYERHYLDLFEWDWDAQNVLFDNIYYFMASTIQSVSWFYLLISLIYFGGIWYACKSLFPKDRFSSLLVYLAAFSTFSYATNGIKAGAAASLFLIALALNDKDGRLKLLSYVLLIITIGFHHSMRLPVVAFVICKLIRNPRFYTFIWIVCFILAVLRISYFQEYFVGLGEDIGDEKITSYLSLDDGIGEIDFTSLRLDFIIYSVVPIIVGWISIYGKSVESNKYCFLLNLYTLVNAVWLLCVHVYFSNRIAYLSWLMYPIVLIYPFLRENWGDNRYVIFKYVAYGHLLFTLFMNFVYYG